MVSLDSISIKKKKVTSDFNMSVHSYKRHIYNMANGWIWVGSFGLRARMGHFKWVENGLG